MFAMIFKVPSHSRSFFKSWKVSVLKAEKVLNPPQNPAIAKSLTVEVCSVFSSVVPKRSPAMKELVALTVKVPKGKIPLKLRTKYCEVR